MKSAFGIDHGEVSKGLRLVRAPRGIRGPGGKRLSGAQIRTLGTQGEPTRTQKAVSGLKRASTTSVSLDSIGGASSKTLAGAGGFVGRHQGLTGAALVGGGTAAGYKYLSQKEPKKSKGS